MAQSSYKTCIFTYLNSSFSLAAAPPTPAASDWDVLGQWFQPQMSDIAGDPTLDFAKICLLRTEHMGCGDTSAAIHCHRSARPSTGDQYKVF